jgi:DNA repair protein RadD
MGHVTLRDYQQDGIDQILAAFYQYTRLLYVLPTGAGKGVVLAFLAFWASTRGRRVTIIVHRRELVRQISQALDLFGVQHGLILRGKTRTNDLVQVAMVKTLANEIKKGKADEPHLLIVDESHHIIATSYTQITKAWNNCKVLGVTATPARLDGKGLGDFFDHMILGPSMGELIAAKRLAAYDYFAPPGELDLSEVRTSCGDFVIKDLEKAMMQSTIVGDAVQHYKKLLAPRPAIAFCVSVANAEATAQQFRDAGFNAASIDGSMSDEERQDRIARLADGRLHVLTSCELIGEGLDIPVCSGVILLRPTKSLAMFLQQMGRALRLKPDGSPAVILDHVANVHRFGMPDAMREWSLDGKVRRDKEPGVTNCTLCFKAFPTGEARALAEGCVGYDGVVCPILNKSESKKSPPMAVDGELQVVTNISDPMRPAWARGISLKKDETKGRAWFRLLELADSADKLLDIAKARGYQHKQKWVTHKLAERAETDRAVATILTSEPYTDNTIWIGATDNTLWSTIRAVEIADASIGPFPSHWEIARDLAREEVLRQRRSAVA